MAIAVEANRPAVAVANLGMVLLELMRRSEVGRCAAVVSPSRDQDRVDSWTREGGEPHMPTGTIKKLVSDRGFGFIAAEDGKEYFFHRTGLDSDLNFDSLAGGERVTFEIEASPKGPRAGRVKPA
jgi:CspA family cold shock protein